MTEKPAPLPRGHIKAAGFFIWKDCTEIEVIERGADGWRVVSNEIRRRAVGRWTARETEHEAKVIRELHGEIPILVYDRSMLRCKNGSVSAESAGDTQTKGKG